MKSYKVFKFLGWLCFWCWIPAAIIDRTATLSAIMFFGFLPLLLIGENIHQKQDPEYAKKVKKEQEERKIRKEEFKIKREMMRMVAKESIEEAKKELSEEKKTTPIAAKLICVENGIATFNIVYKSGKRSVETVSVKNPVFHKLLELEM